MGVLKRIESTAYDSNFMLERIDRFRDETSQIIRGMTAQIIARIKPVGEGEDSEVHLLRHEEF